MKPHQFPLVIWGVLLGVVLAVSLVVLAVWDWVWLLVIRKRAAIAISRYLS